MSEAIIINDTAIAVGQTKEINLNIVRLPTHTTIDLPIYVFRAKKPGPTLLLTAGLHGDEINGIEVIRRMLRNKMIKPKAGTVIAIPIVNIYGFIQTSRKFPDGKDLNRAFPGSTKGSLASLIASVIMKEIVPHIDVGVDFHTGGRSKMNTPHIRCQFARTKNFEYAKAFAPPFIVDSRPPDSSFRKAVSNKGKYILTYEGGESLRLHEHSISEGINGIFRLMYYLGLSDHEIPTLVEPRILRGSWWNRAKSSGIFRSVVNLGDEIEKNQILGYITDPFGESEQKVKARANGYIIGINNLCVVSKGEALIHVGSKAG